MDQVEREAIRAEAAALLAFFSEAELLVLKTHTAIHRTLTRLVAAKRDVPVSDLRRLSFLAAAKQIHSSVTTSNLPKALQLLNDARNIVAHEEMTGEIFIKVGEIGRICKGPMYDDNPGSAEDACKQFREILDDLHVWATHP